MYAKVFSQIYDGTLCTKGPWQALVTFQQMLVLADQDGNVDMTAGAIARRTTIPLEIIETGIQVLMAPDPESRTPTAEGRRIVPLSEDRSWGWQVVNYKHYRDMKREQDRRDYHREYWHKRKLNKTQQPQPNQPIAEADTEADAFKPPAEVAAPRQSATPPAPLEFNGENAEAINGKAVVMLAVAWELPTQWGNDAEALGWKPSEVLREAEKFRQYWVSGRGAGTRRSVKGWRQTWSTWLDKATKDRR